MSGKHVLLVTLCILNMSAIGSAQDDKQIQRSAQIQRRIEKERQVEKIKNEIIKNLENNGATIPNPSFRGQYDISNSRDIMDRQTDHRSSVKVEQPNPKPTVAKPKRIVCIGQPASTKKDGCLNFKIGKKTLHDVKQIIPVRMNLWVHIRKSKKKRNKKDTKTSPENGQGKRTKRRDRKDRKDRKNGRKKNRSRKIKLFVSNGVKQLAKMRMVVRKKTFWYKIELPISQFPDVISQNDSFRLCIECKKCNKNIKLDLYQKKVQNRDRKITIPFIEIEPRSQLPHSVFRHKRSNDVTGNARHTEHGLETSCCKEEVYTGDIRKSFPSIIHPPIFNISYCEQNDTEESSTPQLSQTGLFQPVNTHLLKGSRRLGDKHRICSPRTFEAFTYSFLDRHYHIKYASIPNLIPTGCKCV